MREMMSLIRCKIANATIGVWVLSDQEWLHNNAAVTYHELAARHILEREHCLSGHNKYYQKFLRRDVLDVKPGF